jgi:thioredoxin-like negative regulator of GroEL
VIFITSEIEINLSLPQQVFYFYAPWMIFHAKYLIMISQHEKKELPFFAIDIASFLNQCKRFNISSIPTILLLKNGKQISRLEGKITTAQFKAILP